MQQKITCLKDLVSLPRGTKFLVTKTKFGAMNYTLTLDFVRDGKIYFIGRDGITVMQDADPSNYFFFGFGYRLVDELGDTVWQARLA